MNEPTSGFQVIRSPFNNIIFDEHITPPFAYVKLIFNTILLGEVVKYRKYYLWGGRESAKSYSLHILIIWLLLVGADISIYMVRNLKNTVKQTIWFDILNIIIAHEWQDLFWINHSDWRITRRGANTVYNALGLHSQSSDNVPLKANYQLQTKYALIILEEADQITDKDRNGLEFAIRGKYLKGENILWFELFNPSSPAIRIVNWLETQLPFNYQQAITTGSYYKFDDEQKTLFHRTNWRCNPYVRNDEAKVEKYRALKERSPHLWRNWDLGAMGSAEGMIFANELKFIRYMPITPMNYNFDVLFAGIDFGIKKDAFACVFMAKHQNNSTIYAIDEFYWNNKMIGASHREIGIKCCLFLQELITSFNYEKTLYVSCDYADLSWIEIMNGIAEEFHFKMRFVECYKFKLEEGIGLVKTMMARQGFVFNFNKLKHLEMELSILAFKDNVASFTLKDTENHSFDAFRYGMYPYLWIKKDASGMRTLAEN